MEEIRENIKMALNIQKAENLSLKRSENGNIKENITEAKLNFNNYSEQEPEVYPGIKTPLKKDETLITQITQNNQNICNNLININHTLLSEKSIISIRNTTLQKNLLRLKSPNVSFHQTNMLDMSANFSMNIENMAATFIDNSQYNNNYSILESNYNINTDLNNNSKKLIIVYKLGGDFLLPMQIIEEDEKSNSFRLNYYNPEDLKFSNREICIDKDSVFYQPLSENCLLGIENLTNLEEVNELSIMKNITIRVNNKQKFCFINDIFMFFLNIENRETYSSAFQNFKYEFCDWFDLNLEKNESVNLSNLFIIKNKLLSPNGNCSDNRNLFQFETLTQIIKYKNYQLYSNYHEVFNKILDFIQFFKVNCLFVFSFSESHNNYANIQVANLFPTQLIKNKLKSEMVISLKKNITRNKDKVYKILSLIDFENIFPPKNQKVFIELSQEMLFSETKKENFVYLAFIENILDIFNEINMSKIFKPIFLLILLSYIFKNFKDILTKLKKSHNLIYEEIIKLSGKKEKNIITDNFTFYSNLILLFVFKFVLDLISYKFKENINPNHTSFHNFNFHTKNKFNIGLILSESENEDDMNLLNDLLFDKVAQKAGVSSTSSTDEKNASRSKLTKFLQYNINENLTLFIKNLNCNSFELNSIIYFEKLLDLKLFYDFYKVNEYANTVNNPKYVKIIDLIQTSYKITLNDLENLENRNINIKQIWSFEFLKFEKFFTVEENVVDILQTNKIVEYLKFYKYSAPLKYFAEFSMESFFKKFLPILEDIDKIYNPNTDYQESVFDFFTDLQKFEDFSERFEVTKTNVKINFQSYSLLQKIIKNLLEEKIVAIQKNYKRKMIHNFINFFREKVIKIQKIWRRNFFNKIQISDPEKSFNFLINKYKTIDPVLLKILRNFNKVQKQTNSENKKLQQERDNFNKENNMLKAKMAELQKMVNNFQNDSSLSSSRNNSQSSLNKMMHPINNKLNFSNSESKRTSVKNTPKNRNTGCNMTGNSLNSNHDISFENGIKMQLELKLNNYKAKYKDLVKVVSEHEKKIEKFVTIINSNKEIKDVLSKYGIKIN